ncbi:unnamed protein product [Lasius platythorax]|uniref:Uncharacterized protein n=1 Tax=Lasius platythorax TaxID=488582 RepID=A0AAV2NNZ0_9HYME
MLGVMSHRDINGYDTASGEPLREGSENSPPVDKRDPISPANPSRITRCFEIIARTIFLGDSDRAKHPPNPEYYLIVRQKPCDVPCDRRIHVHRMMETNRQS